MDTVNSNEAIILLYHGVTAQKPEGIENFSGKHIAVDDFAKQMQYLRDQCNPVSLRELVDLLAQKNSLPPRTVAVTFDDSLKNVFDNGYPVLEKYAVPATLFISSGYISTNRLYWSDALEYLVNNTKGFVFPLNGQDKKYSLANKQEKIEAITEMKNYLKSVKDQLKIKLVDQLLQEHNINVDYIQNGNYENLSWDELRAMDRDPLIEIGGHTVNHKILSLIPIAEAEQEIVDSRNHLEKELGHEIDLFSYPEGQSHHYNDAVIEVLKRNNFVCSPSAIFGTNLPGADPFHLRRIMVGFMGIAFPFNINENR